MFATEYNINRLSNNIGALSLNKEHVDSYHMSKADEVQVFAPAPSKRDMIAEMVGHTVNEKYPVRVPIGIKTKGYGAYKRLKSKQEEAISKAGKKSRQCQNCLEYGNYASTCTKEITKTTPGLKLSNTTLEITDTPEILNRTSL
ncbi:hypothetical protein L1987_20290 [Smallanthus sonchifolius]|uniref:Uncharacterized protein n=1 Tax=Smallanthus sonchifolius TaxID=185202 RepID=A0ACB9IR11_9ASTR|nr:hypothetical protein L1987_20290 [Smallanthus sonchifolius]